MNGMMPGGDGAAAEDSGGVGRVQDQAFWIN